MSNIITATLKINGTRPLLWNAFTAEAIPLQKVEKTGVAGNNPAEWRKTVLITRERQLYLQPTYIFGCLRDAGKHTKKGRGSMQPLVAATLQVVDDRILVDRFLPEEDELTQDPEQPVYIDVRSVKNPGTHGRNVRYRVAAASGWSITYCIAWDITLINRETMQAIAIDAGRLVGLGDGRSIGFGRFSLEAFTIVE